MPLLARSALALRWIFLAQYEPSKAKHIVSMILFVRSLLSGLASRFRESPLRTLGALAAIAVVSVVEYFPRVFPWWLNLGVIGAAIIGLIVVGWPLLSIGRSGREAIAERERRLREAEANPLAAARREGRE
jgi:hypothetical protein